MESAWYLAGSDTGALDEFRLMLGRKDPEAQLLGPLQATEFAFGDINLPGITLLDRAQAPGKGALISNHPLSQQNQFDSHSFRGNLPPGWDVELYHNDSLLAFQQSRADGQYNFDDVPLLYGMNYFKLIFYGPFGERRQEEHRFMLGQSLTPPGQFNYRLYYNEDSDNKGHSLADFDLGLNRQASLNFGIASLPVCHSAMASTTTAVSGYAHFSATCHSTPTASRIRRAATPTRLAFRPELATLVSSGTTPY